MRSYIKTFKGPIPKRDPRSMKESDAKQYRRKKLTPYARRDIRLKNMGYDSYDQYLKSDLWKEIRSKILDKHKLCETCLERTPNAVHHMSYCMDILAGKRTRGLVAICNECHTKIEITTKGKKRCFRNAMKRTKNMLRKTGRLKAHT